MNAEAGAIVTLRLLNSFSLSIDQRPVPISAGAQRLVAFLALQDRPRTRTFVANTLWPDTTTMRASANLRSSLWRAQNTGYQIIDTPTREIAIARHIEVDIREAVTRANQLLDSAHPCDDILTIGTRIDLSADILPDWYDSEWVLVEREQYHQLRLHALEAMSERLTAMGRHGEAVAASLAAVRAEPLRESAHHVLMKAHLAAGNRCAAIRQYDQCRRLLHDELGLAPSAMLKKLLPQITNAAS